MFIPRLKFEAFSHLISFRFSRSSKSWGHSYPVVPHAAGLPDSMYVYPVRQGVELPEAWEQWAPPAKEPIEVDAARIQENREDWLMRWSEAAGQ